LHSKSYRLPVHSISKHPRRIFLRAETVFRLSSYCFGHWHEDTFLPASARSLRVGAVSLIRRWDNGLVHHRTEVI
jgi:predicted ATPase